MPDRVTVIKSLHDISGFVASRVGFERAKNFMHTIDEAIAMLEEQEDLGTELTNAMELIHKKNERIEKLLIEQEAVKPNVSSAEQRCGNCNKVIEMDGWKSCPWCGKHIDWKGWWEKNDTRNQDTRIVR